MDVGTSRPKACCHCPFNKSAVLNWFLCAINSRNLSWAGVKQGGHPKWVRSLWEPVSRKRGMASPTTALMQHKSTAILQWEKQLHLVLRFEHFLRRLIRMRTHGEMVISTETDFKAMVYLWTVDRHSYCYELYLTCLLVISNTNRFQFISYFSTVVFQKECTWQNKWFSAYDLIGHKWYITLIYKNKL